MTAQPIPESRGTAAVLDSVRTTTATIRDTEVALAQQIVAWAGLNTVTEPTESATVTDGRIDTGLPLAGDGAPLVSKYALVELCACLGRSTVSGREYVGKILETAHRLPRLWEGVTQGRVPLWRALAIADRTRPLPADAASYVDHHLAGFAAGCTWAQIDRLVQEALVRFDPATAEQQRRVAAERRHFDIELDQISYDGTTRIEGELDLADALDLDHAIARRAKELGQLGCEESLDVRRSIAAGDLARADQTLDLTATPDSPNETTPGSSTSPGPNDEDHGVALRNRRGASPTDATRPQQHGAPAPFRRPGRKVDLVVHLTDTALAGTGNPVARCSNTQTPISPEQVKQWCATPGTTVIVRPVVDLAGHEPIDAYEVPDRHRRHVTLRDSHCRFPHCNRRTEHCDLDHTIPHNKGGPTCPCNLVPLCRGHHRAKTHTDWRYLTLDPGTYLWTSPHGHQYLVDHRGTRALDEPTTCHPTPPPDQ